MSDVTTEPDLNCVIFGKEDLKKFWIE